MSHYLHKVEWVNRPKTMWFTPFVYTGKELDEETGYGYFGARYMDHELMTGWLSVDPMSDKYPNISPYAYCACNPVKLVDPDGREIWIIGSDGNNYQYKDGKLYNKDGSEYMGNDDFATRVQGDLNTLKEKGMSEQVRSLEVSNNKHTIKSSGILNSTDPGIENENNISNGIGCGTTIMYNPNRTEVEGWERPAVVGLAHETQHAFEMDNGIYDKNKLPVRKTTFCNRIEADAERWIFNLPYGGRLEYYYKVTEVGEIEKGEISAIRAANTVYRNLNGLKPRTTYGGFSIKKDL